MASLTREALSSDNVDIPIQIAFPGVEIGPGDTVVDVGCGAGIVCAYAGRMGASVIGIDVEESLVREADQAMRGLPARSWRGITSDCDPIPLPDGQASVVVATEVLEHVPDPTMLLAELVRIGRPGARYVLSVPDPASENLLRIVAPGWYWKTPQHVRVFEHEEFDALIRGAGLEIAGRFASGFEQSLWWTFRMAAGMDGPYDPPPPDSPLLKHWNEAWAALIATSRGRQLAEALDWLVPKSQVVVARKPGGSWSVSASTGPSG